METAVALVDEFWDSITAVAEALLEKKTLSYSSARALVARVLGPDGPDTL